MALTRRRKRRWWEVMLVLCIGSLARGPAGAVRIHIARPEPAGAAPFAVTVALEDGGAEARGADAFSAMLPRKITVEVFAGAADCSGESVLNATELVLAPAGFDFFRAGVASMPPGWLITASSKRRDPPISDSSFSRSQPVKSTWWLVCEPTS